MSINTPIFSIA